MQYRISRLCGLSGLPGGSLVPQQRSGSACVIQHAHGLQDGVLMFSAAGDGAEVAAQDKDA
jgi:hypothetical protein